MNTEVGQFDKKLNISSTSDQIGLVLDVELLSIKRLKFRDSKNNTTRLTRLIDWVKNDLID